LDPGLAALLGALIGAGASVIVQVVAAIVTARHEARAFSRTVQKEVSESVAKAYEFALNFIFNMKTGTATSRVAYGDVFAQIALRGPSEVKRLVAQFLALTPNERLQFDVEALVKAMQQHLELLQAH